MQILSLKSPALRPLSVEYYILTRCMAGHTGLHIANTRQ